MKISRTKLFMVASFVFLAFMSYHTSDSKASNQSSLEKIVLSQSKLIKNIKEDQLIMNNRIKSLESMNKVLNTKISNLERQNSQLSNSIKNTVTTINETNYKIKDLGNQLNLQNNSIKLIENKSNNFESKFLGLDNRIGNLEKRPYPSYPNLSDIYSRLLTLENDDIESKRNFTSSISRLDNEEYWTGLFRKAFGADNASIQKAVADVPITIELGIKDSILSKKDCLTYNNSQCSIEELTISLGQSMYNISDYITDDEIKRIAIEEYNKLDHTPFNFKTLNIKIYSINGERNLVIELTNT